MGLEAFEKFINPKPKNGVIREQVKKEKKAAKKEKREFFEKKKAEKKASAISNKIY